MHGPAQRHDRDANPADPGSVGPGSPGRLPEPAGVHPESAFEARAAAAPPAIPGDRSRTGVPSAPGLRVRSRIAMTKANIGLALLFAGAAAAAHAHSLLLSSTPA